MFNKDRPISIAIVALGGQGGGVLAQWVVDVAEANGYIAQYTSVPGVAQRTGSTIYFIELFPEATAKAKGQQPVLALMPAPGDVDIVIASELIEAGRAIMRGLVSPDLTTLIASDHRVYAISEKEILGDGRMDDAIVRETARKAAKRLVLFDMNVAAEESRSVISSILFGSLAGSGALPFPRQAYEDTIRKTGKAVETNLVGFARGFEGAEASAAGLPLPAHKAEAPAPATPAKSANITAGSLLARIAALPASVQEVVRYGVNRLIDYQDKAYAATYLDRLDKVAAASRASDDADHLLLRETARYLALWMSFEDIIRVADLKVRSDRFEKIRDEVKAQPGQIFYVGEYFHPRYEEFCDTLPASLGRALMKSGSARKLLAPLFAKGRTLQTAKLSGFLPLFVISKFRRWRRGTLRYVRENALIEAWLDQVLALAAKDYALATEVAECPRLIKGYGDTHQHGTERFLRITELVPQLEGRANAAATVRALREAALKDEAGAAFRAELAKVA